MKRIVLLLVCLGLACGTLVSHADEKRYLFSIEQQQLKQALQQFARQADLQLIYAPEVIPDRLIAAVTGNYSSSELLGRLLVDTDLEFIIKDAVVVIRIQQSASAGREPRAENNQNPPRPSRPNFIEEFIVTAQKRQERLQDVPIAILVAKGDKLKTAGISRLEALAPLTPGFHFSEAVAANDQLFIRGLGSGVNFGFENAVGQVIDDFYYGRSRFGRAAFLDVERVEVLKGPQGTLTGKNTTAGAINITSKLPTEKLAGWLAATHEYQADRGDTLEGAVSGPLANRVTVRLALRLDDRDGWANNVVTGEDGQSVRDVTGRITVKWQVNDSLNALMRYQAGDLEREGRTRELSRCGPELSAFLEQQHINEDCRVNLKRSARGIRNGTGDFQNFNTDFDLWGLTLDWDLADKRITSLTGYAGYQSLDQLASGLIPVEVLNLDARERWRQWTQELRVTSDGANRLDYIFGVYYAHIEQQTSLDTHFADLISSAPVTRVITTEQDGDSFALFGQFTWHFSDSLAVTAGGRFNYEREEAGSQQFPAALYTRNFLPVTDGPAASSHYVTQHRSESNFSPAFSLQWRPWEEGMAYAAIRRGFKGGGFDHQLVGNQEAAEQNFQFNEEQVIAYELGAKLLLNEGRVQLNIALFRNEFDDLQVSSVQDNVTFNVGNAASAITQGLELDGQWYLHDSLSISWAAAYLDAYYHEFKNAPCSGFQLLMQHPDCKIITPEEGVQDLSGKRLQYAPQWSFSAEFEYRLRLSDRFRLTSSLRVYYSDDVALALDLDPYTMQQGYVKLDARFTLTDAANRWELSVIGRNLTDKITSNFANDLSGRFSDGSYFRFTESPLAVAVQGLIRF